MPWWSNRCRGGVATASSSASRVNGDGSFNAQEIRSIGTFASAMSMSSTLLTITPRAQQFGRHLIGVVTAIHRVARNQRNRGGAVRRFCSRLL